MKTKILTLSIASLFNLALLAQTPATTVGGTTFGLRAGVNFQNVNGKHSNGNDLDYTVSTGFHIGANAEIPVGTSSYLQPGVLYSIKGAKGVIAPDTKLKLSYIEIPINYVYKPTLGTGQVLLGFGPYVGFGINGKIRNDNNEVDVEFKNTANVINYNYTFKRFDAGANALAGYQFANGVSFQLNTQLGLININPDLEGGSNGKARKRNTGFGVSLGYRF